MKKHLKMLLSNSGFSYVMTAVLLIVVMMIAAAIMEYMRIYAISSACRDKFEDTLVEVSVENYRAMYASARDGFTASYSYNNGTWKNINNVSATRINDRIYNALNAGEELQVNSVSDISFNVNQTKGTSGSRFQVSGTCTVVVPFRWLWVDTLTLNIGADTEWTSQF